MEPVAASPVVDQLPALSPPFRFAMVESGLYRGAHPTLMNYRFLKRCVCLPGPPPAAHAELTRICRRLASLRLATIVSLTPEPPVRDLADFCSHSGIESIHIPCEQFVDAVTLTPRDVARVLEVCRATGPAGRHQGPPFLTGSGPACPASPPQLLIDAGRHPLYIHCLDGSHVTGLVVMCLRKAQRWQVSAFQNEFSRCGRGRAQLHPATAVTRSVTHSLTHSPLVPVPPCGAAQLHPRPGDRGGGEPVRGGLPAHHHPTVPPPRLAAAPPARRGRPAAARRLRDAGHAALGLPLHTGHAAPPPPPPQPRPAHPVGPAGDPAPHAPRRAPPQPPPQRPGRARGRGRGCGGDPRVPYCHWGRAHFSSQRRRTRRSCLCEHPPPSLEPPNCAPHTLSHPLPQRAPSGWLPTTRRWR